MNSRTTMKPWTLCWLTLLGMSPLMLHAADQGPALTLAQAHDIALRKHPRISVAQLNELASRQVVNEARSAYYPTVSANLGAVVTGSSDTRVVSGILPVSSVFNRASASVIVSQLITDFGRTSSLVASSKLKAGAGLQDVEATRSQILLEVDGSYFGVLQAQSVMRVAEETVQTRGVARDQIVALAKNQLKSSLDVSFAEVNYQEAELLLSRSRNDLQSSFATLAAVLDEPGAASFDLISDPKPGQMPGDVSALVTTALENRPDLRSARLEQESAAKFASAESALRYPTLAMQGTAGVLPYRDSTLNQDYAAAGIVLTWPVFTGGLYTARKKEADLRAEAAAQAIRDRENNIARDVRIAWLNASNTLERVAITGKLRVQAQESLKLAQARYDAGSSSIVELSQAQLNLTSAQINEADAKYEYLIRRSALDYQTGTLK
jgi:outer membrane protein